MINYSVTFRSSIQVLRYSNFGPKKLSTKASVNGIKLLVLVWIMLFFFPSHALTMGRLERQRDYNLLLITVDTLRADHLGCYGYKGIKTPNIDKLASEGIMFIKAITPVPITLPSHSSIMTGLYPRQHGVRNNGNFFLPEEADTLAEIMKGQGYKTGAVVGAFVLDSIYGLDQGFDFYEDNFTPGKKRLNFLYNERNAEMVNQVAFKWLEDHAADKFFLWLHYFDPHSPYMPPIPFNLEYQNCLYDGEIAYVDNCIGALFRKMHQLGLMDKTMIIFTADHGEGLGDHNELTHAIFIYDSTVWVPLIMKLPQMMERQGEVPGLVSTIDILPTIIDLFRLKGLEMPAGKSLIPIILGKKHEIHTEILCESMCPELNFGWSALEGVRTPDWKYVYAPKSELYDLIGDPEEKKNLMIRGEADHGKWQSTLDELKRRYPPVIKETKIAKIDAETAQRLRSLGYIWTKAETASEEKRLSPDPKDKIHVMNYIDHGMGYLLMGLFDPAIEEFQKVLRDDPNNIVGYFNLASAYEEKGDVERAEAFFKKVLELSPQHADAHNHLGLIAFIKGDWGRALEKFQRALESFDYVEVYYNVSLVYEKLGKFEDAMVSIKKTIELDPDYAEGWNQLGSLQMVIGEINQAVLSFKKATDLDPTYLTAYNNLGLAYTNMGDIDKAISEFQEAIRLDPDSTEAHNNLGSLYMRQKKYGLAEAELNRAIEIRPDYLKAIINLGMLNMSLYDLIGAEELFNKALNIDSNSIDAINELGNLYIMQEGFDKALSLFQKAIEIQPDNPRAHYDLGRVYQALGETDDAIGEWQRALQIQPGLAGAHLNLGNAYFEMGSFEAAEKEWEKAFTGQGIDIQTHLMNLGYVYFQTLNYMKALLAFERAGEMRPGDQNIHYSKAVTYFRMERYEEAAAELKECLRIQPDFQNAQMLMEKVQDHISGE